MAPVIADTGVPGLVMDDEDWDLGFIMLFRDSDVCASLCFDFNAIQTLCRQLNLMVPDNARNKFGLVLQRLHKQKDLGEAKA